jgi:hypothetical protein
VVFVLPIVTLFRGIKKAPAEHSLSHRCGLSSAAEKSARPHAMTASPAQFVLLISRHPKDGVMQCKEVRLYYIQAPHSCQERRDEFLPIF